MSKSDNTPNEELRDNLVRSMLPEAMGTAGTPDLVSRVRAELAAVPLPGVDEPTTSQPADQRRPPIGWSMMAAAAGFLLVMLGLFATHSETAAVGVQLHVVQGEIHYVTNHQTSHFEVGSKTEILLAVGDRFSNPADTGAVVHLQPLGILTLSHNATVEIRSMNWTKKDSGLVLASLTVGAVAGGFAWNAIAGERTEAGESMELVAKNTGNDGDKVSALQGELARLKQQNVSLREAATRRKMEPAPKANNEDPEEELEEQQPADQADIVAMFKDPQFGDALTKIDWQTLGVNMNAMLPLLDKLAKAINEDGDIPLDVAGEIQKQNGDLIVIAKAIMDAKIPGSGINGSFSHPSVAANQIGAVLQAAGLKLSDDQQQRMERIRELYAAKDKSLRMAAPGREFGLENLLEEVSFKDEFYREARSILSDEQRGALSSDAIRGRLSLDLFDSGLVLAQYAKPLKVSDPGHLTASLTQRLGTGMKLDKAGKQALQQAVSDYARKFPESFWQDKPDALGQKGMLKTSRIRDALRRQIELMRVIMKTVPMTKEQLAKMKKSMRVIVPLPR